MARPQGLEPRSTESESGVLPLHHGRTESLCIQTPCTLFNFFSPPSSSNSSLQATDWSSDQENFSQHGLLIEKFPYYARANRNWPLRLAVRTAASHAVNTGSIPVGVNPSTPSQKTHNIAERRLIDTPLDSLIYQFGPIDYCFESAERCSTAIECFGHCHMNLGFSLP